ncbi:vitamin K-dependent gamma-carboxylase [Coccinella septempunctata]|uniref:vitamin K-dependent gamma-carboxylase n=1 Tax=Coccinella septempunctata TaxID=41139 RepID=UPI001D071A8A|nr:vitamin K-dependent gamma-carboxylase [Coccinella septempunctata]
MKTNNSSSFLRKMFGKFYTFDDLVSFMYLPKHPSSLGVIRIMFGLLMMLDLPEERGGADISIRYGNPQICHFPLMDFIKPLNYEYMSILYGIMWLGTIGITLGLQFRLSVLMFAVPYWYIFLLDKSFWNNHTYLYGLLTILLLGSSANHYCSLDGLFDKRIRNKPVPNWNYFILKFQFFMLYFLAGIKKSNWEWLEGYAMNNMGNHWVFIPFRLFLTPEQVDYLVIHWIGCIFDLTIGFLILLEFTRPVGIFLCSLFHLMNSRMFSIGLFPYVCLATLPLFCEEDWPEKLRAVITGRKAYEEQKKNVCSRDCSDERIRINWKRRLAVSLLLTHCALQTFLPFSHSITKGYNNWTNGLYGYSWDMMVHGWDTNLVVVKVVDNVSGQEYFLDSSAWTLNDRWNKHADMCVQYAQCVKKNLAAHNPEISKNISVYIDVWCSMNGRIQQRMFDPNYDLLKANWSVFNNVEWLLPLLSEYSGFREKISKLSEHVYSWSNSSDVVFISDFPDMSLENYVSPELRNVSLEILEGTVLFESQESEEVKVLNKGERKSMEVGKFHKIYTIGEKPSFFIYTYINSTKELTEQKETNGVKKLRYNMYSPFPLLEDVAHRISSFEKMMNHIYVGYQYLIKLAY